MKELLKSIFTKDNAKSTIEKFNDNIDKVIALRSKLGKKSLVGLMIIVACVVLNHFDILGGTATFVSIIAGIYTFIMFGLFAAFHILEFYVTSKINAAVGTVVRVGDIKVAGVTLGNVTDEITDYAIDKVRGQRSQNDSSQEQEQTIAATKS